MPVTEFGGLWGYNPRLLTSIHQAFGTPAELQSLVDTCHKAGLAVIFDVVLNHGAARLNSLWAYDGWNPDNGGGIYHNGAGKTPWGKKFAFGRWEVDDYMLEGAEIFLREYNGELSLHPCLVLGEFGKRGCILMERRIDPTRRSLRFGGGKWVVQANALATTFTVARQGLNWLSSLNIIAIAQAKYVEEIVFLLLYHSRSTYPDASLHLNCLSVEPETSPHNCKT